METGHLGGDAALLQGCKQCAWTIQAPERWEGAALRDTSDNFWGLGE